MYKPERVCFCIFDIIIMFLVKLHIFIQRSNFFLFNLYFELQAIQWSYNSYKKIACNWLLHPFSSISWNSTIGRALACSYPGEATLMEWRKPNRICWPPWANAFWSCGRWNGQRRSCRGAVYCWWKYCATGRIRYNLSTNFALVCLCHSTIYVDILCGQ